MNRTLGFGIVTGGVLTSLGVANPAGAHDPPPVGSEYGYVDVRGDSFWGEHTFIYVFDSACDGMAVFAQYKLGDGSGVVHELHPACNTAGERGQSTPITNYRKCEYVNGASNQHCGDWLQP